MSNLVWNSNGQLAETPAISFEYNWDGRLSSAVFDNNSISLKYDPQGNRVYKASSVAGNRRYIVDISGKLPTILMEIDGSNGSITNKYYYANAQILRQDNSAGTYYYVHDRLGSVRLVVNEDGDVNNTYTYNAFGEMFASECNETVYNSFKFTGQWWDDEIGQYYLRARMYDPVFMRFTSIDPVRGKFNRPLTLHPYLYCINNPVNRIDPSGRYLDLLGGLSIGLSIDAASAAGAGLALGATYGILQSTAYHNMTVAFLTSSSDAIQNIGYAMAKMGYDAIREEYEKAVGYNAEGTFYLSPGGGGDWKNKAKRIGFGILAAIGTVGGLGTCQELLQPTDEEWEEFDDEYYWDAPSDPSSP